VKRADFMDEDVSFAELTWRGRRLRLEYRWTGIARADSAPVVFLHEGLGSLATWKNYPGRLCGQLGLRGLVFSRPGYGRSTPRGADEVWGPDFMHLQAREILPLLFDALMIERPWLFGHSDGASIALLHAAAFDVAGVVAVAPHVFVEDLSIRNIERARLAYVDGRLREVLTRYHDDPDSAFWGWKPRLAGTRVP